MSELRQNLITKEWVIITTERAQRPHELAAHVTPKERPPAHVNDCPFCAGNEKMTERETFRVSSEGGWKVRVVANKYPALSPDGESKRTTKGIYRSMTGIGVHEVIIESPRHDLTIGLMPPADVTDILRAYLHRYREVRKDPRVEAIIIFKNHGEGAGTSLGHPHSQLAATPVVPNQIRSRIEDSIRYFDETGECIFCRTLREELLARERIVLESEHFVAFVPYAALSPFHMWIFPRRHQSSFDMIYDSELENLAAILRSILARLYHGLNNPDFNYSIRSIPIRDQHTTYFHWYLAIIPRVSRTAGFELGSGMFINTSLPEESAKFLRDLKVND